MRYFRVARKQLRTYGDIILIVLLSPVFFAVSYISANLVNVSELLGSDVAAILLFSGFISAISLIQASGLYWIFKKIKKPLPFRIILIVVVLINFTAGYSSRALADFLGISQNSNRVFVLSYFMETFIVFTFLVFFRKKLKKKFSFNISRAFVFGLLVISVMPTYNIFRNAPAPAVNIELPDEGQLRSEGYFEWFDLKKAGFDIEAAKKTLGKYDIYYFILDGYPSFDIQKNTYGLDDGTREKLESLGFYIAEQTRTNYQETFLAVPSMLRMRYLHETLEARLGKSEDQSLPRSWMKQNETVQLFKNTGYKFASLSPWNEMDAGAYDDFDFPDLSAIYFNVAGTSFKTSELQMTFTSNNILKPLDRNVVSGTKGTGSLEGIRSSEIIAQDQDSTFAQIYSWLPHPPPYFDSNGNPVKDPFSVEEDLRLHWSGEGYKMNIIKINEQLIETLESILTTSKNTGQEPVILVASDHGSANLFNKLEYGLDSAITLEEAIKERYKNFAAFYFPDKDKYEQLDSLEKISPVNYGRILANNYLGQRLDLLEDKAYYAEEFYLFDEVTRTVWE